jgi:tetratricopeptide (TPR) repeat protein
MAEYLGVETRTLYRWLNPRTPLTDTRELRRIALLLGVEPERLIAGAFSIPLTAGDVDKTITAVWGLIKASRYREARQTAERLVLELKTSITSEDDPLIPLLAKARQCAGHVASENARTTMLQEAIHHYHEMEILARILDDDTLVNIALTYQGDMYRRQGNVREAITFLEAARDSTPDADPSARGNAMQLLGRAYLQAGDEQGFHAAMGEATSLLGELNQETDVTSGFYCAGTVYEEYARSYSTLGRPQEAMNYLDKAEAALPMRGHWETMLKTARAMVLVRSGDLTNGMPLALEASRMCIQRGDLRHLERMVNLQRWIDRSARAFVNAGAELRDVIAGETEYTG